MKHYFINQLKLFFGIALLLGVVFPVVASVSAQTYTISATPVCDTAGQYPTVDSTVMYAFWPNGNAYPNSGPQWQYSAYTKTGSTINAQKTNTSMSGLYVGLVTSTGRYLAGKTSSPASSSIDVGWIGWSTQVPMINMRTSGYPNGGSFSYTYRMPPELCGTPSYTFNLTAPNGGQSFVAGQQVTVTWNFSHQNQPVNVASSIPATLYLRNGSGANAPAQTLSTAGAIRSGANSLTVTIPSTVAGGNTYRMFVSSSGGLNIKSGATTVSTLSDESDAAFTIVKPSPTPSRTPTPSNTPIPTSVPPTSVVTPSATPVQASPTPSCSLQPKGDADCNGAVQSEDFTIWSKFYLAQDYANKQPFHKGDFNNDGKTDLKDAEIWRMCFTTNCAGGPSPTVTASGPIDLTIQNATLANRIYKITYCNNGQGNSSGKFYSTFSQTSSVNMTWFREDMLVPQAGSCITIDEPCRQECTLSHGFTITLDGGESGRPGSITETNEGNNQKYFYITPNQNVTATVVPTVPVSPTAASDPLATLKAKFVTDEGATMVTANVSNVQVKSDATTTWNNGCRGCGGNVCTQAIVTGKRVVLYAPANTGTNQCVFHVYHVTSGYANACSPPGGRTVTSCTADPFPPPNSSAQ